jgi:hypothetical protein
MPAGNHSTVVKQRKNLLSTPLSPMAPRTFLCNSSAPRRDTSAWSTVCTARPSAHR